MTQKDSTELAHLCLNRRAEIVVLVAIIVMLAFVTLQWGIPVGTGFIFGALAGVLGMLFVNAIDEAGPDA